MQEPEEEEEGPAVGRLHLNIEHGDVETESTASEHWPGLPVEEEVHVEDPPAGDQTSSVGDVEAMASTPPEHAPRVMEEEEETSGDSDGEEVEDGSRRMRPRRGRRSPRMRRGRSRGGLPVYVAVGTAAAVMLLAIMASWKRLQRRRGRPAAGAG